MTRKRIKVAAKCLNINSLMHNALSAVNKEHDSPLAANVGNAAHRIHEPEHIGNMGNANKLGAGRNEGGEQIHLQMPGIIHRERAKRGSAARAHQLPGDNIRMVFALSNNHLVPLAYKGLSD